LINVKDVNGNLLKMDFMLMELQFGVIWLGITIRSITFPPYVNVSFDVSENLSFEGVDYDNGK
jgi:hypothetical protein